MIDKDHDLLISISTKVKEICRKLDQNAKEHEEILKKLDKKDENCRECRNEIDGKIDKKVSTGNFQWAIGGLVTILTLVLMSLGGVVLNNKTTLEKHIAFAKQIVRTITGTEWDKITPSNVDEARENYYKYKDKKK